MGRVEVVAAVLPGACVESVAFGPAATDWNKCEVLSVVSARDTAATGGILSVGDAVETVDDVAMTHSQLQAYLQKRAKLAPRDTVSIMISRAQPVPSPGGDHATASSSASLSLLPPSSPSRRGGGTALPQIGAEGQRSQPHSPQERARASAPPSGPGGSAEFVSINAAIAAAPMEGKTGIVLRGGVCVRAPPRSFALRALRSARAARLRASPRGTGFMLNPSFPPSLPSLALAHSHSDSPPPPRAGTANKSSSTAA
jgi:hypothetical protein